MFGADAYFGRFPAAPIRVIRVDNGAPVVITSVELLLLLQPHKFSIMTRTTTSAALVLVGLTLLRSARCGALAHA